MGQSWVRERWWEFRTGHSTYLIFMLTFVNFVLISYRLLIEKVPAFQQLIPELWIFALLFLGLYIPTAIIIGYWHRRTQLKVENTITMQQNPFYAKLFRMLIDVELGNLTKEEIEKYRSFLIDIEKKMDY
ncbi:hypothetical protein OAU20_01570 [Nitrosopumilus sp.]|jgi:hypothetical protein|nr:hypothetical protein [Nitrosopumilus sp.]|tara:strand:- start:3601 stop:3990 length:390 start_codon:yes stop_codon:yes gene_type:complete